MNKYQLFCKQMIDGNIPHNQKYYALKDFKDSAKNTASNVKVISPTQSSVDRAKSEVKEEKSINSGVDSFITQMGGSSKKSKKSSKKSGVKKSQKKQGTKKRKNKQTSKPKKTKINKKKSIKGGKSTKSSAKWM